MNIVTLVVLFIVRLISMLPLNMIGKIGSALGVVGFYLAKKRRNVGLKNLSLCFPQMSIDEKRSIIKQHFKYLVTSALEYGLVFYAKPERLRQFIHLKNFEYVLEHYGNRPVILLCPHFVGLDLGAIRLTLDIVGFSIYSRQKNSLITEKLKEARIRFIKDQGGAVFARQDGLRPILKRLKETKQVFYYLPDQDFGERDSIYVPFFAYPTCATVNVLPKLVQLSNAVVVPLAVYRVGDHYEVEFTEAWDNYPSGDITADVSRMNKYIEGAVSKNIAQYFWLHKRFKTQPNQERGALYKDC